VHTRATIGQDIASLLLSAAAHPEWLSEQCAQRPPSGQLLLYARRDGGYYKHDGYTWKKRKDGRLTREDHMKLKVKGIELLYGSYAHSALVPTFHRRAYWLLQVRVHCTPLCHQCAVSRHHSRTLSTHTNCASRAMGEHVDG
jgi:hypothetical protein